MPRFPVPNASLIASADLPILPFLAPRVFAESSIPRRKRQQHARHDTIQEKEEKTSKCVEKHTKTACGDDISENQPIIGTTCHKQRIQQPSPAGLLQTSGHRKKGADRPASANRLYAEISSFVQQYARSCATETSNSQGAAGENMSSQPRVRRVQSIRTSPPSTPAQHALSRAENAPSRPRVRRIQPKRTRASSALVKHASSRAENRLKALSLERARLSNYVSRLPPSISVRERVQLGQYRSLRRRVENLTRWNLTHLDLTDGSTKASGLHYAFAALDRPLYPALRKYTFKVQIKHDPRCARLSRLLFPAGTSPSPHQVWLKWIALDISTREAYVHKLLIYLLDRKPGRALRFIQVLANDPLFRGRKTQAIADALSHLSKLHHQGLHQDSSWGTAPEAHKRNFVPSFMRLFVKSLSGQRNVCSQDLLYNLVKLAKIRDLKRVFDCFLEHKVRLEFDTALHYASTFGEAGEVQYALKCLDTLKASHKASTWDSAVDRERLRWTCAVILRRSMVSNRDFHQTPVIVAAFVRLGMKIDILLYNVIMHNAMEAGDPATAFKVYNTLESNNILPDKYTFGIMLHGCTMQDNPGHFQSFAQYCEEVAQDIRDPWLATECLYYLYVRHRVDEDAEQTSALLWQSYTRFFTTVPLQSFVDYGTTSLRNAVMSQPSAALDSVYLSPTPVALYIMLQTEIRSALAISDLRVYNLYLKFKSVVEGGDPKFDALVGNPTVWNAFLYAFCQRQQFANASQLIQDMTDGPAKPNVYSWNIFMHAFFKQGQVQAAERVFQIMRDRGVDPDQYTWGVLVRGYANAQLADQIGDVLPHVDAEREVDPELMRHLAKVVDRRKLMGVLEKSRVQKEASALEKAAEEDEEERSWWQSELGNVEAAETSSGSSVQSDATGSSVLENPIAQTEGQSSLLQDRPIDLPPTSTIRAAATTSGTTSVQSGTTGSPVSETLITQTEPISRMEPISPTVPIPRREEQSGALQDQPSDVPTSTKPPQSPKDQPRAARANLQDPEVQYRKLQERLGLVEPASPADKDHAETKSTRKPRAGPVFKSIIVKSKDKPEVPERGQRTTVRIRARSIFIRPRGGGDLR